MNTLVTQGDSDKPAPGPHTTYDLIICHEDRIVFHDHYEAPEQRLRMCVGILTNSDALADPSRPPGPPRSAISTTPTSHSGKTALRRSAALGTKWSTPSPSCVASGAFSPT